mgnify:CR=1 FL=1
MKNIIVLLLFLISMNAWSDMLIETIQLHNRSAEEILPIIEPMLDEEGSLTGTGYKLIIKSTPSNITQIRTLIEEIDINPRNLKISVSYRDQSNQNNRGGSVSVKTKGEIGSVEIGDPKNQQDGDLTITSKNDKVKFDARIYETSSKNNKTDIQTMSVTEGYWGTISMGQSIPYARRTRNPDGTVTQSTQYKKIMTGFRVMPRTNGDNVTITIQQQKQNRSNNGISVDTSEIETVVTGKLGQWIFIGGTDHQKNLSQSGLTYNTRVRSTDVNQVWIKVERP